MDYSMIEKFLRKPKSLKQPIHSLRYIGTYYNNGLLTRTHVYVLNEETLPYLEDSNWNDYGYTGTITQYTGRIWSTISIEGLSILGYIVFSSIFVLLYLFYSFLGLILSIFYRKFTKSFFKDIFEHVTEILPLKEFKQSTHINSEGEGPPIILTKKELAKYFSRKSIVYPDKRFSNDPNFTQNMALRFTSRLLYLGRLENEWKALDENILEYRKEQAKQYQNK